METIKMNAIKEIFAVRKNNPNFTKYLAAKIEKIGYQNAYPVSVTDQGVLWDGVHRYEAMKLLGREEIPVIIETPYNIRMAAHERNQASETALPETFVDHAEEIWEMMKVDGATQQSVADILGWSRDLVARYDLLKKISKEAWKMIVTAFSGNVTINEEGAVTTFVTPVTITENLLRTISKLTYNQQEQLVSNMLNDPSYTKGHFKEGVERYKIKNHMNSYIRKVLEEANANEETIASQQKIAEVSYYFDEFKVIGEKSMKLNDLLRGTCLALGKEADFNLYTETPEKTNDLLSEDSINFIITTLPDHSGDKVYHHLGRIAKKALREERFVGDGPQTVKRNTSGGSILIKASPTANVELCAAMMEEGLYFTYFFVLPSEEKEIEETKERHIKATKHALYWFSKGVYADKIVHDDFRRYGDENLAGKNANHEEKNLSTIVDMFTEPEDRILDPFMVDSKLGIAALNQGRKYIGITDNEEVESETRKEILLAIKSQKANKV